MVVELVVLILRHQAIFLQLGFDLIFVINWRKSDFVPSPWLHCLGMILDTILKQVFPSHDRLSQFWKVVISFFCLPRNSATMWHRLIGHMLSLERFLPEGPLSHETPPVADHWSPVVSDPACPILLLRFVYRLSSGSKVSHHFCQRASTITVWAERNSFRLEARYILANGTS